MDRRVGVRFPSLVIFFGVLLFGTVGTAYADAVFQPERHSEILAAEPLTLQLRSIQQLPITRQETTTEATSVMQTFGKPSDFQIINRMIRDPDVISVNPERGGLTAAVIAAPEPATMLLLGTGLAGVAGLIRKRYRDS